MGIGEGKKKLLVFIQPSRGIKSKICGTNNLGCTLNLVQELCPLRSVPHPQQRQQTGQLWILHPPHAHRQVRW